VAILGASGAGKTLALRLLAGIARADRATVQAGGRSLAALPAEERGVGYLPQHSALMPRRTVWQQITFAVDADPALAAWWLEKLGLTGLEDRFPSELSGGQQRRVALARALARNPGLVLLDEPFSALDSPVRARLYRELRRLQREAGLTTVLVTHDPEEAALLADEVIILEEGGAIQQGSTAEVFARPDSAAVAALLGVPNTYSGRVARDGVILTGGIEINAPTAGLLPGKEVTWAVRPEGIVLDDDGLYPGTVLDAVTLGALQEITVVVGALELTVRPSRQWPSPIGASCRVDLPIDSISVWPAANGRGSAADPADVSPARS
jgi:molybdate transport system permease protein